MLLSLQKQFQTEMSHFLHHGTSSSNKIQNIATGRLVLLRVAAPRWRRGPTARGCQRMFYTHKLKIATSKPRLAWSADFLVLSPMRLHKIISCSHIRTLWAWTRLLTDITYDSHIYYTIFWPNTWLEKSFRTFMWSLAEVLSQISLNETPHTKSFYPIKSLPYYFWGVF